MKEQLRKGRMELKLESIGKGSGEGEGMTIYVMERNSRKRICQSNVGWALVLKE